MTDDAPKENPPKLDSVVSGQHEYFHFQDNKNTLNTALNHFKKEGRKVLGFVRKYQLLVDKPAVSFWQIKCMAKVEG